MLDMYDGLSKHVSDSAPANSMAVIDLAAAAKPGRWSIGGVAWSYAGMAADTSPDEAFVPQLDTSAGIYMVQTPSTDTTGAAGVSLSDSAPGVCFMLEVVSVGQDSVVFSEPVKFAPGYRVQIFARDGGGSHTISVLGAKLV